MKSTLIVVAVALTSGLLIASGAVASEIDVMGPEYNRTPSLDSAVAGGAGTQEIAPAGSRHEIDVMGREYNTTPSVDAAISGGVETGYMVSAEGERVPAASHNQIDVMGRSYEQFLFP